MDTILAAIVLSRVYWGRARPKEYTINSAFEQIILYLIYIHR